MFLNLERKGRAIIEGTEYKIGQGRILRRLHYEEHTFINDVPGELTL